jgi:hypothetical protein
LEETGILRGKDQCRSGDANDAEDAKCTEEQGVGGHATGKRFIYKAQDCSYGCTVQQVPADYKRESPQLARDPRFWGFSAVSVLKGAGSLGPSLGPMITEAHRTYRSSYTLRFAIKCARG